MVRKAGAGKDAEDQKVNLDTWKPSQEELKAARELLLQQDDKKRKSSTACMVAWVNKNDEKVAEKVAGLRGEARAEYTAKYMAYMTRKKNGTLTAESSHTSTTATVKDFHFWCKHQIIKEVGEVKAQHWIDSNLLAKFPDRITGATSEDLCEYKVPVAWLQEREQSDDRLGLQGSREATKDDVENIKSFQLHAQLAPQQIKEDEAPLVPATCHTKSDEEPLVTAEHGPKKVFIKKEPGLQSEPQPKQQESAEDKAKNKAVVDMAKSKITSFLAAPAEALKILQHMELEANMIIPLAKTNDLMGNFCEQLVKHLDQVKKMVRGVASIVQGNQLEGGKCAQLVRLLDILQERHETLRGFAITNGIWAPEQARKSERRKRVGR